MPRPTYPSDDKRRKTKPHVKVHLSLRGHPRYAQAWTDPETRGVITGLWMIAGERFASRTGDVVTLTIGDLGWITGREKTRAGLTILARACRQLDYPILFRSRSESPAGLQRGWCELAAELQRLSRLLPAGPQPVPSGAVAASVWVRNFSKKQGFNSADHVDTPGDSADSATPPTSDHQVPTSDHQIEERPPTAEPDGTPGESQTRPGPAAAAASRPPEPQSEEASKGEEPRKPRARPPPPGWATACASLLIERVRGAPGAVIPRNAEVTWAREVERLVRESPELAAHADPGAQVRAGIEYAFGPDNLGGEYEVVVRSGRALREKWPKLVAAARRAKGPKRERAETARKVQAVADRYLGRT